MNLYIIMYHIARSRVTSPTRHCCCCDSLADQTHRFDHWRSFDQLQFLNYRLSLLNSCLQR